MKLLNIFRSTPPLDMLLLIILVAPLGIPYYLNEPLFYQTRLNFSFFQLLFVLVYSFGSPERRDPISLPRNLLYMFTLWFFLTIGSVIFSEHPVPSMFRHCQWLTQMLFGWSLWSFLRYRASLINGINIIIATGYLFLCAGLVIYWNLLPAPESYNWVGECPYFINIRHFSHYSVAILLISTSFISRKKPDNFMRTAFSFLTLSICWGAIFWSGGRGGIIAAIFGTIIFGVLTKNRRNYLFIITISCLTGLYLSTLGDVDQASLGLADGIQRTTSSALSGRMKLWTKSLEHITQFPLLGSGPDGFRFFQDTSFISSHPHNVPLQLALDWGIPSAAIFMALCLWGLASGFKRYNLDPECEISQIRLSAFSLISAFVVYSLVDGILFFSIPMAFTGYAFALLLLPVKGDKKDAVTLIKPLWFTKLSCCSLALSLMFFSFLFRTAESGNIPSPTSPTAVLIRTFPVNSYKLLNWCSKWRTSHPDKALSSSLLFARNMERDSAFWEIAADICIDMGDMEKAAYLAHKAIDNSYRITKNSLKKKYTALGIITTTPE